MKTLSKILFASGVVLLLANCRTSDDGTNNHGKATEGIVQKNNENDTGLTAEDDHGSMNDTLY